MKQGKKITYVHEGRYMAEVEIEVMEGEGGWSPYLSVDDAYRIDDVRDALRQGDVKTASKYGRIYELHPVANG